MSKIKRTQISKTCGICFRSEPEIKISLNHDKPRLHNMCNACRAAVRRTETRMKRYVENIGYETLTQVNYAHLTDLEPGNYHLTFGLEEGGKAYPGGVLCLREDFVWVYTYEGAYQWPKPYDLMRVANHLAYLHLYLVKKSFPTLSDEEKIELEKAEKGQNIKVFGVC